MEITGRIIFDLPEQNGTSKAGNAWRKKEYVLETEDTYPKKVHFDFFGDRVEQFPLEVGQRIKLSFDIESREYNGRWYTSIRGWKAETAGQQPMQQPMAQGPDFPPAPIAPDGGSDSDLPF